MVLCCNAEQILWPVSGIKHMDQFFIAGGIRGKSAEYFYILNVFK